MSINEDSIKIDANENKNILTFEEVFQLLHEMTNNPNLLKNGFDLISKYQQMKNFYFYLVNIIFNSNQNEKISKLAISTVGIFLRKNWTDQNYISEDEKKVIIKIILGGFKYSYI